MSALYAASTAKETDKVTIIADGGMNKSGDIVSFDFSGWSNLWWFARRLQGIAEGLWK